MAVHFLIVGYLFYWPSSVSTGPGGSLSGRYRAALCGDAVSRVLRHRADDNEFGDRRHVLPFGQSALAGQHRIRSTPWWWNRLGATELRSSS
ncbi:hypothetical protein I551_8548 [Mycobacterium ulcerans str. Harvey]|uniref:Secreted protein n=1 Tax=Mycobacterium ulcerans str. Harvey TaxID=1299332 RepID=A0ABN0RAG4_MYCUL|nr:hypothetical protein I551_8548 [Mycobacterium ulcerans str. Harvey]